MARSEPSLKEQRMLEQQFRQIDQDGNNRLDREELQNYLLSNNMDEEHCKQIIDEIFQEADDDYNGYIDLSEFTKMYLDIKNKLVVKQTEIMDELTKNNRKRDQAIQAAKTNPRKYSEYGRVTMFIEQGLNFPNGVSRIAVSQAGQQKQTRSSTGNNPSYNQEIAFDIQNFQAPIEFRAINDQNREIGNFYEFYLMDNENNIYNNEARIQIYFQDETQNNNPALIQIRLKYNEHDFARIERQLLECDTKLDNLNGTLYQVQNFLQAIDAPFGFLSTGAQVKSLVGAKTDDPVLSRKPMLQQQKAAEKFIDEKALKVAKKFGYEVIPYIPAAQFMLALQLIFTCLSMYYRADFVTLTIVAYGFYLVEHIVAYGKNSQFKEVHFTFLMYAIILSIVYDILWFCINNQLDDDGTPETGVKKFSYIMSFLSFFLRFAVFAVFFKIQIAFDLIVRQSQEIQRGSMAVQRGPSVNRQSDFNNQFNNNNNNNYNQFNNQGNNSYGRQQYGNPNQGGYPRN